MYLPSDPAMLLSVINTKLRDECESLSDFADTYDIDLEALSEKLSGFGLRYDEITNRIMKEV